MSVSPTEDRSLNLLGSGKGGSSADPSVVALSDGDDRLGMKMGKYVVTRRLGRGGMGIVYEARDNVLRRKVAIKFFSETVAVTTEAVKRFVQEAQAAARLNHPNVVSVYEVGKHQGNYFLVMELVRGTSAEEHLKLNGAFDWAQATAVTASACRALAAAHAAQLIHRDIKPANLLLCSDPLSCDSSQKWHVKLGDFGLAKLVDGGSMATAADRVLGTPNYMSPEQCRSEALDPRTDLYSLGATYYSLLTAKPPFARDQSVQVMFAHCWSPIPDPRETDPSIPEACAQIVRRAMAKDTHDRYRSAREMLSDLEAALLDAPAPDSSNSRFKPLGGDLPINRGVIPGAERDAPPFSRPLDPALPTAGAEREAVAVVPIPPPVAGSAPAPRKRRRLLLMASVLLLAVALTAAIVGRGRLHWRAAPILGTPATLSAKVPGRPPSLTEFRWSHDAGGVPSSILFFPDGRRVLAGVSSGDGGVRGWDTGTGRDALAIMQGAPVSGITFSPEGNTNQIFAAKGNEIVQWSFAQEAAHAGAPRMKGDLGALAWGGSPSGKRVLALQINASPPNRPARLVLFNDQEQEMAFDMVGNRDVLCFCFLGTSGLMATGSTDQKIRLWAVNTLDYSHGYALMSTIDDDVAVYSLASSADGTVIAAAGRISTQFFQADGKKISKVFRPNNPCRSLALSPDGLTAAIGSGNDSAGDVTLYDVNAGEMIAELIHFDGAVTTLAFSPDGSLLATGCMDHTVKCWDLQKLLPDRAAPAPATKPAQANLTLGHP